MGDGGDCMNNVCLKCVQIISMGNWGLALFTLGIKTLRWLLVHFQVKIAQNANLLLLTFI